MRILLYAVLLAAISNAFAASDCKKVSEDRSSSAGREILCQCGPELTKLKVQPLFGFRLYGVCSLHTAGNPYPNYVPPEPLDLRKYKSLKRGEVGNGLYYFEGSAILTGIVKKGDEINRGSLYFYPRTWSAEDAKEIKKITPETIEFSFGGPDLERQLGSTKLEASWGEKHWCAPVTIRLTKYELEDWDSEGAGHHALRYELLHVGKFKRCVH